MKRQASKKGFETQSLAFCLMTKSLFSNKLFVPPKFAKQTWQKGTKNNHLTPKINFGYSCFLRLLTLSLVKKKGFETQSLADCLMTKSLFSNKLFVPPKFAKQTWQKGTKNNHLTPKINFGYSCFLRLLTLSLVKKKRL